RQQGRPTHDHLQWPILATENSQLCTAGHSFSFPLCAKRRLTPKSPATSFWCERVTSASSRLEFIPIFFSGRGRSTRSPPSFARKWTRLVRSFICLRCIPVSCGRQVDA